MSRSILFICTGNSCRSQMAEGYARKFFPKGFKIYSAGLLPSRVQPSTKKVMEEDGVDISDQHSKGFFEVPVDDVDRIVTLCDRAKESCPVFPANAHKEHWSIADPFDFIGTMSELDAYRKIRDEIKKRVEDLAKRI